MGHERVGLLPRTTRWRSIVEEIAAYNSNEEQVADIAKHTIENVRNRFRFIQSDSSVLAAFQFLVALSSASKLPEPQKALDGLGIILPKDFSPFSLTCLIHEWVTSQNGSAEYGYLAKAAAGDAVVKWYEQNNTKQLKLLDFPNDSFEVWRKAGTGTGFCELARLFFSNFTERYLNYFLDREASSVIKNVSERELFQKQLESHVDQISKNAFETAKITQSFAAGWFNNQTKEKIPSPEEIEGFLSVAFGKIRDELVREGAR